MSVALLPPGRGILFVLSGPSGVGKDALLRPAPRRRAGGVLGSRPSKSISATTRTPRPGEVDGADYHFWDEARFQQGVEQGAFLEWARVFGRLYGTPHALGGGAPDARART